MLIGLAVMAGITVSAKTTNVPSVGQAFVSGATNWAAVPYGIYRTDTKQWGFGGALLYKVADNFWAGVRADNLSGTSTTAGVQAQLQATVTWHGVSLTPFLEASSGMGRNSLYASAGPGAYINIHDWNFKVAGHDFSLSVGAAGDYEHIVNGSSSWQQVCGGPLVRLSF